MTGGDTRVRAVVVPPRRFGIGGTSVTERAEALWNEYAETRDPRVLDAAVRGYRRVLALNTQGHPGRAYFEYRFATALSFQARLTGDTGALDEASAAFGSLVERAPAGHPSLPHLLDGLAGTWLGRYALGGGPSCLDTAISLKRDVLARSEPGDRAEALAGLADVLRVRFEDAGAMSDLDEALDLAREAARPDGVEHLATLVELLLTRFQATDADADLEEAATAAERALAAGVVELSLGRLLHLRFHRFGDRADLDRAVALYRTMAAGPSDSHSRAAVLSFLARSLRSRFEATGGIDDLEESTRRAGEALDLLPPGHLDRVGCLVVLSQNLVSSFNRRGTLDDLEQAVRRAREAAAMPGGRGGFVLLALHHALLARHRVWRRPGDLDEAIDAVRESVTATDPVPLVNLADTLIQRHEDGRDPSDVEEAVRAGTRAVELAADDDPDRVHCLYVLAVARKVRHESGGGPDDLEHAVGALRAAVAALTGTDVRRPAMLSTLGDCLRARGDLDEAVALCREAVATVAASGAHHAMLLTNLAVALHAAGADTAEVDAYCREAAASETASPAVRMTAARAWAGTAYGEGRADVAHEAMTMAIDTMPRVAWVGLDRTDREGRLAALDGLAADAAAAALADGDPASATRLLDRGRSVIWRQNLDLDADLSTLARTAPDLGARLAELSTLLRTEPR